MDEYERDEQEIEDRFRKGEIDVKQYNKEMKSLYRDYKADAEEAATQAYNHEMNRW